MKNKDSRYISRSEKDTVALGKKIAKSLKPGDVLCLVGDLGSGKTTFVKGLAQGLGIDPNKVNSPTFVLQNVYSAPKKGNGSQGFDLYHYDLYRLDNLQEISGLGIEEFLYGNGVTVIEWADKLKTLKPKNSMNLTFEHKKDNERVILIRGQRP